MLFFMNAAFLWEMDPFRSAHPQFWLQMGPFKSVLGNTQTHCWYAES